MHQIKAQHRTYILVTKQETKNKAKKTKNQTMNLKSLIQWMTTWHLTLTFKLWWETCPQHSPNFLRCFRFYALFFFFQCLFQKNTFMQYLETLTYQHVLSNTMNCREQFWVNYMSTKNTNASLGTYTNNSHCGRN